MKISIVIPTFNRGRKLLATVRSLLANETNGFSEIDIIVVDDGSDEASAPIVESLKPRPPFSLSCIRQTNRGPAAARNTGFRASRGQIVLFVDDDIVATPDLVQRHVEAHREKPKSVICGRCPPVKPNEPTPLLQYLDSLPNDPGKYSDDDFIEVPFVASGQVSFERRLFDEADGVYHDDLVTPAAEEFELSDRLRRMGTHILVATRIVAQHDQPVDIRSICQQQYKYGVGCSEVAAKCPTTTEMKELVGMLHFSRDVNWSESLQAALLQSAKILASTRFSRTTMLKATELAERNIPRSPLLKLMYRAVIGSHFLAGLREGKKRFTTRNTDELAMAGESS
jgi:GT2 family glycosyltransferase